MANDRLELASDLNLHQLNAPEWTLAVIARRGLVTFDEGITSGEQLVQTEALIKLGLAIWGIEYDDDEGMPITDWHVAHLRSGYIVCGVGYPFASDESAKQFAEDLFETGANFRLSADGIMQWKNLIYPLVFGYKAQCDHYWKTGEHMEDAYVLSIRPSTDEQKN